MWDSELTLLKDAAIRSFTIWSAVGKPRCDVEFDNNYDTTLHCQQDSALHKLPLQQTVGQINNL